MSLRTAFLCRGVRWHVCGLAALVLLVYLIFPTRNHYWDGIGFALNIEGIAQDQSGHLVERPPSGTLYYNPNHLLYNAIGWMLYKAAGFVVPGVRALDVLVLWSTLSSVAAACLLFGMLVRFTRQRVLSVWLTLLFAFSATWWKFSTDANAYVPSTALLVGCAWLAAMRAAPPVILIALLHALAMLLHQIAIWFYPAMWLAMATHRAFAVRPARIRAVAAYTAVSASVVTAAYLAVWFSALDRSWDAGQFFGWLTFNGSDVFVRKPVAAHVADMARSVLRVFFGGKLSNALRHGGFVALIPAVVAVVASALMMVRWWWAGAGRRILAANLAAGAGFLLVWLGGFTLFLSCWLTEFPYYRLFCLPAFIVLVGIWLRGVRIRFAHPVPAFVVLMAAMNFSLYIYPYSRPETSPPMQMAMHARTEWREPVVVYFADFNCDNWWLKYFNMHTEWRLARLDDGEHLKREAREQLARGRRVFLDTGVLEHLDAKPEVRESLRREFEWSHRFGVSNGKHNIRFAELFGGR